MRFKLNYMYEVPWGKLRIPDLYECMCQRKFIHGNLTLESFQQKFQKMFSPKTDVTSSGVGCWLGLWVSEVNIYKNYDLFQYVISKIERDRGSKVDLEELHQRYPTKMKYAKFAENVRALVSGEVDDLYLVDFKLI